MDTINSLTPSEAAVAGGLVGGAIAIFVIISLAWWILQIIACWRMFEKAGEPGWKAIIPIYNYYIMFKIVDMKGWFWATIILSIVYCIIMVANGYTGDTTNYNLGANPGVLITAIVYVIFAIVVEIIYSIRTSRAFGHGGLFAAGLFFFQPIFQMIIGFGKSKYHKKAIHAPAD